MITDYEDRCCGGCEYAVFHFSHVSREFDYYTCKKGRCAIKCFTGVYNY